MDFHLQSLFSPTWESVSAFLSNHSFWDPLWAAAFGTLLGTGSTFWFERRRRDDERRSQLRHVDETRIYDEIGKCHALHYWMMRKASILRDVYDQLLSDPKEIGKRGILFGTPLKGDEFNYRDFGFLLDTRETGSPAPKLISAIGIVVTNFNATLDRIAQRNELLLDRDANSFIGRGEAAMAGVMRSGALGLRINELTKMIAADVVEGIQEFETAQELLQQVMTARYPGRPIVLSAPKVGEPNFNSQETGT
jgi:hypothetical protein